MKALQLKSILKDETELTLQVFVYAVSLATMHGLDKQTAKQCAVKSMVCVAFRLYKKAAWQALERVVEWCFDACFYADMCLWARGGQERSGVYHTIPGSWCFVGLGIELYIHMYR